MSKDRYQAKDLQNLDDRRLLEKCVEDKKVLEVCNTTEDFWSKRFDLKYQFKIENMKNTKYEKLSPYKLYLTMLHDEDILARNILRNVSKYDDRDLIKIIVKLHISILKIGWNFNEYTNDGIIVSKTIKTKSKQSEDKKEANLQLYIILNNGWPLTSPDVKVLSPEPKVNKVLQGIFYKDVATEINNITIPMKQFENFANIHFLKLTAADSEFNYNFPSLYPKEQLSPLRRMRLEAEKSKLDVPQKDEMPIEAEKTKIDALPKDVMLTIMSKLDDKSLLKQCQVNKDMRKFCEDENFWRNRLVSRFKLDKLDAEKVKSFKTKGSWKDFYLNINRYLLLSGNNNNNAMYEAAKGGDLDLVKFFIEQGAQGANQWNYGMLNAAYGGHQDLVDFFIGKGAKHWNYGMYEAARGGHLDIVKFFIGKGANNLREAKRSAEAGGHQKIVKFFEDEMKTKI